MNPETLILGPGGAKGFMILGALKVLKEKELLKNVKRFVGISIGSSIALLMVCGYDILDILYESLEIQNIFTDLSINLTKLIIDTTEKGGLISNEKIKAFLEKMVKKKFGFIPDLKKLYELTELELVSVALNLSQDRTEYISYKNFPDISCVEAVLLSMNIPLVFQQIKYNNDIYVDGALGDPYPAGMFPNSLGVIIYTRCELKDMLSYISSVTGCYINQYTKRCLDKCKTIIIPNDKNYLDDLTSSVKMDMYYHGYNYTKEYLNSCNN